MSLKNKISLILIGLWLTIAIFVVAQTAISGTHDAFNPPWLLVLFPPEAYSWFAWIFLTPAITHLLFKLLERGEIDWRAIATGALLLAVILALHIGIQIFGSWVHQYLVTGSWESPDLSFKVHCYQTVSNNYMAVIIIVAFGLMMSHLSRAKSLEIVASELQSQLLLAKSQALKSQLQPHFLFNTHNAINTLILDDKPKEASEMLRKLTHLLRSTLDSIEEPYLRFSQEIEIAKDYLDIYQTRFEDRLEVRYDIDENALNCFVPNFLIQPIIENAIKHGFEHSFESAVLLIQVSCNEGRLLIVVQDNGDGAPNVPITEGVGLSTTRKRLEQCYGKHFDMSYGPLPEKGFRVSIDIPCNPESVK